MQPRCSQRRSCMKFVLISCSCKLVKFLKTFHFGMLNVAHIDKSILCLNTGACDGQLVEALCYKPEGCRFDFQWCHWNFSLTYSFQQLCGPVKALSTRNISLGAQAAGAQGCQPYHLYVLIVSKSVRQASWNPLGLKQAHTGIALPFT